MNLPQPQNELKPIDILLVDDDEGDVILTKRALKNGKMFGNAIVAYDGVEAMQALRQEGKFEGVERPDLILLDLNMPRMDGRETLAEIKKDPNLKDIPVVIMTTSDADFDIIQSYDLDANCYFTKPVDLPRFMNVVQSLQGFYLCVVKKPQS